MANLTLHLSTLKINSMLEGNFGSSIDLEPTLPDPTLPLGHHIAYKFSYLGTPDLTHELMALAKITPHEHIEINEAVKALRGLLDLINVEVFSQDPQYTQGLNALKESSRIHAVLALTNISPAVRAKQLDDSPTRLNALDSAAYSAEASDTALDPEISRTEIAYSATILLPLLDNSFFHVHAARALTKITQSHYYESALSALAKMDGSLKLLMYFLAESTPPESRALAKILLHDISAPQNVDRYFPEDSFEILFMTACLALLDTRNFRPLVACLETDNSIFVHKVAINALAKSTGDPATHIEIMRCSGMEAFLHFLCRGDDFFYTAPQPELLRMPDIIKAEIAEIYTTSIKALANLAQYNDAYAKIIALGKASSVIKALLHCVDASNNDFDVDEAYWSSQFISPTLSMFDIAAMRALANIGQYDDGRAKIIALNGISSIAGVFRNIAKREHEPQLRTLIILTVLAIYRLSQSPDACTRLHETAPIETHLEFFSTPINPSNPEDIELANNASLALVNIRKAALAFSLQTEHACTSPPKKERRHCSIM